MMRKIIFNKQARQDLKYWTRTNNWRIVQKISGLICSIQHDPYDGPGKPEALKGSLSGFWSRRIDKEHRIIYGITDQQITVVQCRYHYSE